jgi:uncharacterized protein YbjT (DUF2867 family)
VIAVIGATGFTGHRIVHAVRESVPSEAIAAVVRPTSDRRRLASTGAEFRLADLADVQALTLALRGAQTVVCAASLGFGHAQSICTAIAASEPRHAVFFSTTSISTRVPNTSRETRILAEQLIWASGVPATIVRPTMIYGRPGDRNIERLLEFLRWSPVVPVLDQGRALQQPVHVDDLAEAVVAILGCRERTVGRTYNLPGPEAMSYAVLVQRAGAALGRRPLQLPVPGRAARTLARAWSRTHMWPRVSEEQVKRVLENKNFSWSEAGSDFGYRPRPFAAGVALEATLLRLPTPRGLLGTMAEGTTRTP